MIVIATKEIKKFIEKSSGVADTRILPIYGYVKLVCTKDRSYFVKHNGNRFVVFDVEANFKNEITLMIETKTLFGFSKFSDDEYITISVEGKNIKLDDGKRHITCQATKDLYPTIEDNSNSEKIEIPEPARLALMTAKNHCAITSESVKGWQSFVHLRKIKEKYFVIATRGEVTFFKGFEEPLPEISLDTDVVSVLKEVRSVQHSTVGNYDYFETIGTLYGFIKPETKCADAVDKVLERFNSKDSFEIDRHAIIKFCRLVSAVNSAATPPEIKFEGKEDHCVKLKFKDMADNVNAEEEIKVKNKTFNFDEIIFQPKNILTVLEDLKADEIKISYAHKNFIITTDEPDYIGAAMELGFNIKN